jgi:asparagine synthase (glutamine-hydrolysing)
MCGIFGIVQYASLEPDASALEAAYRVQAHRGPDGHGIATYTIGRRSLTFAHQRLSIIDLSDAGLQPMEEADGAGSVIYNGELYNYLELRAELEGRGRSFLTRTDTEVLLTALREWGPDGALSRFNWMGALAWLDRTSGRLVLACDSASEKPLYCYSDDNRLLFASEIKTLLTLLGRKLPLDRDVVGQFVFQGLTDASTRTFFEGIRRIEAGTFTTLDLFAEELRCRVLRFTPPQASMAAERPLPIGTFIEELRRLFIDAVRLRLRSDVPVGVLLSGGLDSSSIAAVAQRLAGSHGAPRLLSAISEDPRFDESAHIGAMERYLGQRAHRITLRMAPETLVAELSEANWYNDAPVAGLSALAHRRLMKRAKELGLTVILSGQGADETLLGYSKFLGFYLQSLVRRGRVVKAFAVLATFLANRSIIAQFNLSDAKRYVPLLRVLSDSSGAGRAQVEGEWLRGWNSVPLGLGAGSLAERQILDLRHFSVPMLCHYEDRMSMAESREIRLPFLDPRLIDLLLAAPDDYKLRRGWTKYALRKAMEPMLPPEVCWRRDKRGFANPEGEWLKRELREAVLDAFGVDSLVCRHGILDSSALLRLYAQYRGQPVGRGSIWYREIFAPLSLELWMQRYAQWIA